MQKRLNSSGLLLRLPPNGASYAQAKEAGQTAAAVAALNGDRRSFRRARLRPFPVDVAGGLAA